MHAPADSAWPIPRAAIERAIAEIDAGRPFKAAYETLLLDLDDDEVDRTTQLQRESRGAWLLMLQAPATGQRARALLAGNALSGTSVALARLGFDVTLLDLSALRLGFASRRNRALASGRTSSVAGGDGLHLPFRDASFDVVVLENGLPGREGSRGFDLGEARRVCAGELVLIADNRLAYKRSSGRRGVFEVAGPLDWAGRATGRSGTERTLRGYRSALAAAGFGPARAFALYPDAREFTFVVGLDGAGPSLVVGPKERANVAKVVGEKLGLFPWLAPSFALVSGGKARDTRSRRADRLLAALAARLGEPAPEVEHLVATRGNSALLLTRPAGRRGRPQDDAGRWCIHVGLSTAQERQLGTHFAMLEHLSRAFPAIPVPQPLFAGRIEGLFLTCERRLEGLAAPQLTGNAKAAARTLLDAAGHFAQLVTEPAKPLTREGFDRWIGARFDAVAEHASRPATLARLEDLRNEARNELVGLVLPRVAYHADLRRKHLQVRPDGSVAGYLDWGSSERAGLPYFDLFHLVVHEHKEGRNVLPGDAWREACEPNGLAAHERAALDGYCEALCLPGSYRRTIERIYPVLVAAMAETHWDFSRPRWLHRQFGL